MPLARESTPASKLLQLPLPAREPDVPDAQRRSLPTHRRNVTLKLVCNGHKLYLSCGEYEDGTLGEIFIDTGKDGTVIRSQMNMFAISISLGLQHGTPLREFVNAFSDYKMSPAGVVVGHEDVKEATSLFDMVVRVLEAEYGDGKREKAQATEKRHDPLADSWIDAGGDESRE